MGGWLDWVILQVFSNLGDSMILTIAIIIKIVIIMTIIRHAKGSQKSIIVVK